jgi:hypothetical protein
MPAVLSVLAPVAGAALVLMMGFDIAVTTLDPTRRGPLSHRGNLALWRWLHGVGRRRSERALRVAGPLTVGVNFALWGAGLWIGFALIYLPSIDEFTGATGNDVLEALYVSGSSLTTLGFGDIVATQDSLRLITTLEAASGLTTITAAIAYLLSSYGATSEMRTAAARMTDLGAGSARGAAELVVHGGSTAVLEHQRELIAVQQHLRHFPSLFYFHTRHERESLLALLRASALVCLVLRWGVDEHVVPHAEPYGHGLERSLRVVMDSLHDAFDIERAAPRAGDTAAALGRLRAAVSDVDAAAARRDSGGEPFATLLADADGLLTQLAEAHGYGPRPLLG